MTIKKELTNLIKKQLIENESHLSDGFLLYSSEERIDIICNEVSDKVLDLFITTLRKDKEKR